MLKPPPVEEEAATEETEEPVEVPPPPLPELEPYPAVFPYTPTVVPLTLLAAA